MIPVDRVKTKYQLYQYYNLIINESVYGKKTHDVFGRLVP